MAILTNSTTVQSGRRGEAQESGRRLGTASEADVCSAEL